MPYETNFDTVDIFNILVYIIVWIIRLQGCSISFTSYVLLCLSSTKPVWISG